MFRRWLCVQKRVDTSQQRNDCVSSLVSELMKRVIGDEFKFSLILFMFSKYSRPSWRLSIDFSFLAVGNPYRAEVSEMVQQMSRRYAGCLRVTTWVQCRKVTTQ